MENIKCNTLGSYISQIHRKSNSIITKKLSKYGIGSGQYMFLIKLYKEDGINQESLSESLFIDKGTTARAIKRLEEEGFIYRVKDKNDKRAYRVYLTDKAWDIKDEVFNILEGVENIITLNLTSEEKGDIIKILKKISTNDSIR